MGVALIFLLAFVTFVAQAIAGVLGSRSPSSLLQRRAIGRRGVPFSSIPGCNDDDDDCQENAHTSSRSQSGTLPTTTSSPITGSAAVKVQAAQTPAVVALACVLSAILLTIAVFFLWRRFTRRNRQSPGPRPYIEISDAESRPASIVERAVPFPVPALTLEAPRTQPQPQPFFRTQTPSIRYYRTFTDLRRYVEGKQPVRGAEGGAIVEEEEERHHHGLYDSSVEVPPPGYRSMETIVL
ncbi:hypothetical protein FB451DRAFT_1308055, partial [Mycena latifolia]